MLLNYNCLQKILETLQNLSISSVPFYLFYTIIFFIQISGMTKDGVPIEKILLKLRSYNVADIVTVISNMDIKSLNRFSLERNYYTI